MYLSIYIFFTLFTFTPSLLISVDASSTSEVSDGISTSLPSNSSYAFNIDYQTRFTNDNIATEISQITSKFSCATPATKLTVATQICFQNIVARLNQYSQEHLLDKIHNITVGCCFHEQLNYCIKPSIQASCPVSAANVTDTLMQRLQLILNIRCQSHNVELSFPSDECDEILFPKGQIQQLLGLLIAVAVFSAVILCAASSIIIVSKRSKHREQYQAL